MALHRGFEFLEMDASWTPFKAFRIMITCIGDAKNYSLLWNSMHDYAIVYSVDAIGDAKLSRVYRCTWTMLRCEIPFELCEGSPITIYMKPRSPLPWYLTLRFFWYWKLAMPAPYLELIEKAEGRSRANPPGTGANPQVVSTSPAPAGSQRKLEKDKNLDADEGRDTFHDCHTIFVAKRPPTPEKPPDAVKT